MACRKLTYDYFASVEAKPKSADWRNTNGNIGQYFDSSGAIAAKYEYSPEPSFTVKSGAMADSLAECASFSTKPWDEDIDAFRYELRILKDSRWMSRDRLGERGGWNLYGMVFNNAVNKWDYLGSSEANENCVKICLLAYWSQAKCSTAMAGCVAAIAKQQWALAAILCPAAVEQCNEAAKLQLECLDCIFDSPFDPDIPPYNPEPTPDDECYPEGSYMSTLRPIMCKCIACDGYEIYMPGKQEVFYKCVSIKTYIRIGPFEFEEFSHHVNRWRFHKLETPRCPSVYAPCSKQ